MTTSEEFLLILMKSAVKELEMKIDFLTHLPEDVTIAGLDDGKIIGYTRALELISIALYLYQKKVNEEKND